MTRYLLATLAFLLLIVPLARADQSVLVRTGIHKEYSRVVFDWHKSVPYKVKKISAGMVLMNFEADADIDLSGIALDRLANILEIRQESTSGNLSVALRIDPGSEFRHFTVGQRVVFDVYNPAGGVSTLPKQEPKQEPNKRSKSPEPDPLALKQTMDQKNQESISVVSGPAEQPPKLNLLDRAGEYEPHVVTVSLTETVGIASFVRGNTLWVVLDNPNVSVPPQLRGPDQDDIAPGFIMF